MPRFIIRYLPIVLAVLAAVPTPAAAGLPRGVVITADEQSADDTSGATIARGNAEIAISDRAIAGTADVIEVRPKLNEILMKGRAKLSVGASRYESDTIACSLDFMACTPVDADQDLPPLPAGIAATIPR